MSNITVSQSLGKKSRAVPQWWFVFGEEGWLLTQLTYFFLCQFHCTTNVNLLSLVTLGCFSLKKK